MAANQVSNVRDVLEGFPLEGVYCWLDSSVALYWIKGGGDYKQFVSNRVQRIQEKEYIQWRHVGTKENEVNLGSRGGKSASVRIFGGMGHRGFPTKTGGQNILLPHLPRKHTQKPRS